MAFILLMSGGVERGGKRYETVYYRNYDGFDRVDPFGV